MSASKGQRGEPAAEQPDTRCVVPQGMRPGPIRIQGSCAQQPLPSTILTVTRA